MKVRGWLAAAAAIALVCGALLAGGPSLKALAAIDMPAGQAVQGILHGGSGMHMGCGIDCEDIADFLGISREDFASARQSGQSIVQIAGEKGISEEQLVDYLTQKFNANIDQKVASGKINGEQADKLKQSMAERVKEDLNRTDTGPKFSDKSKMGSKDGAGLEKPMGRGLGYMADLAHYLGVSQEELIAARRSGKSIVQIAGEKGISEGQLLDYMAQKCGERIDQQAADGKITSEQAEKLKQSLTERIKAELNRTETGF